MGVYIVVRIGINLIAFLLACVISTIIVNKSRISNLWLILIIPLVMAGMGWILWVAKWTMIALIVVIVASIVGATVKGKEARKKK